MKKQRSIPLSLLALTLLFFTTLTHGQESEEAALAKAT